MPINCSKMAKIYYVCILFNDTIMILMIMNTVKISGLRLFIFELHTYIQKTQLFLSKI